MENKSIKVKLSIILLDWSVREYFQALHFLKEQSVSRNLYELIWVELYDREANIVKEVCDQLICCHQSGIYHKHKGYNAGLLAAKGELVCICDSDAVFPNDFVERILHCYYKDGYDQKPERKIVQVFQRRTKTPYPGLDKIKLKSIENDYEWETWNNVCACGIFLRNDIIAFGGFDEHKTYRGFFCGYSELTNRMVNMLIDEYWIPDSELAIWHFAHLRPTDPSYGMKMVSILKEIQSDEIDGNAIYAIECIASGRFHPLVENYEIKKIRMTSRKFASELEQSYADGKSYYRKRYKRFTGGWIYRMKAIWTLIRRKQYDMCIKLFGKENYEKIKIKLGIKRRADD